MRTQQRMAVLAAGLMSLLPFHVQAEQATPPVSIRVYPPDVQLTSSRDRQSLIVQAHYGDGITRDVTTEAKWSLSDTKLASIKDHVLTPAADGTGELHVEYAGHVVKVPVEVKDTATDPNISFRLDVMPVFMKANCNTGSCHGAARGKDGVFVNR